MLEYRRMLGFPTYFTLGLFLSLGAMIAGVAACLQAFFDWRGLIREWREQAISDPNAPRRKESGQLIMLTLGGPLFILVGVLSIAFSNYEIYTYRSLELDRVTGASIQKIESEYVDGGERRLFTDVDELRSGLSLLGNCSSEVVRNHESFRDGYRIHLYLEGNQTSDYYITYFDRTNASASRYGIVAGTTGTGFSCPSFKAWVKENIDPLFK